MQTKSLRKTGWRGIILSAFFCVITVPAPLAADQLPEAVAKAREALVIVEALDRERQVIGRDAGAVIDKGLIVTNLGILRRADQLAVIHGEDKTAVVVGVVAVDRVHELALLQLDKADAASQLAPLTTAGEAKLAMRVFVTELSESGELSFSMGGITATGGKSAFPALLAADAGISRTSRGGAWLNDRGEVVAITYQGLEATSEGLSGSQAKVLKPLLKGARKEAWSPAEARKQLSSLPSKWTPLVDGANKKPSAKKSQQSDNRPEVTFNGPNPEDSLHLGEFKSDGTWTVVNRMFVPTGGKNAVASLAVAEEFEMEASIGAEGTGGWFFLLGWDGKNGYALYNPGTRDSGSPWIIAEIRDGQAVAETHLELARYQWKGTQSFVLRVERVRDSEPRLFVTIGGNKLIDAVDLPRYGLGNLVIGTYDTKYGPRAVKVFSLKARAK